jgi:hypothetical protein
MLGMTRYMEQSGHKLEKFMRLRYGLIPRDIRLDRSGLLEIMPGPGWTVGRQLRLTDAVKEAIWGGYLWTGQKIIRGTEGT